MSAQPARASASEPPRTIACAHSSGKSCSGKAAIESAVSGRPPIAYTSESAFVAAIAPKAKGSSTTGVKKSTVCTSAVFSSRRKTPASSPVRWSTSTRGSSDGVKAPSTWASSAGPSLLAQPAAAHLLGEPPDPLALVAHTPPGGPQVRPGSSI